MRGKRQQTPGYRNLGGGLTGAIACALLAGGWSPAAAAQTVTLSPVPPADGSAWTDAWRAALDLSLRVADAATSSEVAGASAVGFDVRRVFSASSGDIGTLQLQGYATGAYQVGTPTGVTTSPWKFVFRNFWFNYTGLGRGQLNVRVGHLELPFGAEYVIETNGTIRQTGNGRSLGIKGDWGVSLNGIIDGWEYEVALTRGTGQDLTPEDNPHAFSGRVGSSRFGSAWIGTSFFSGRVNDPSLGPPSATGLESSRNLVDRWRLAFDGGIGWRRLTLITELGFGKDEDLPVRTGLVDLSWETYGRDLVVYLQWKHFARRQAGTWGFDDGVFLGARHAVDRRLTLSAEAGVRLRTLAGGPDTALVRAQVRYRR